MSTKMCPCRKACDSYNLYLRIAKKQCEIDIQRAVEWFSDFLQEHQNSFDLHQSTINFYVKQLENSMKGE